ncbi:MAG: triose-phosphate isomerase [Pseudomonadota bacterium]|nr:triose-phosphate isomerase [Pseudomonadota bacterium]
MENKRRLIAGNWKMNGLKADGLALAKGIHEALQKAGPLPDVVLCPPATLLALVADALAGSPVSVGGQDCHPESKGAFTGNISAPMLADLGCSHVIVGHSERRQHHGETDDLIRRKAEAAHAAGLVPVVCVGETQEQRDTGQAFSTVEDQIRLGILPALPPDGLVVAYEPVWAIGTGRVATADDIGAMHTRLRGWLKDHMPGGERVRLLYGGSVKASNCGEIFRVAHVDGALVGGASLLAEEFVAIVKAAVATPA